MLRIEPGQEWAGCRKLSDGQDEAVQHPALIGSDVSSVIFQSTFQWELRRRKQTCVIDCAFQERPQSWRRSGTKLDRSSGRLFDFIHLKRSTSAAYNYTGTGLKMTHF